MVAWSLRDVHHVNELAAAAFSLSLNVILCVLLIREKDETLKRYSRVLMQNCFVDIVYTILCLLVEMIVEADGEYCIIIVNGFLRFLPITWYYALVMVFVTWVMLTVVIVPIEFVYRYCIICKDVILTTRQVYYMGAVSAFVCSASIAPLVIAFAQEEVSPEVQDRIATNLLMLGDDGTAPTYLVTSTKRSMYLLHVFLALTIDAGAYAIMIVTGVATCRAINRMSDRMSQNTLRMQGQLNRLLLAEAVSVFVVGILPLGCILSMLLLGIGTVGYGTMLTAIMLWVPLLNPVTTLMLVGPYRRAVLSRFRIRKRRDVVPATSVGFSKL